ncbi:Probable xyloglucan galactosyltransferase GT12 [Linum perenne]
MMFSLVFISRYTMDYNSAFISERNGKLSVFFTSLFSPSSNVEHNHSIPTAMADNTCAGRYIYVHRLPNRFNDEVVKNCYYSLLKWWDMCPSLSNFGFGTRLQNPSGKVLMQKSCWYATNQFTLEVIFRHRMNSYECLTNDSSLASAIFVPYYAGFDIGRHLWGDNTTVRDALGIELVNWLRNQPEWNKGLWGRDHFFVSGRIAWDLHRSDDDDTHWGSKLMQLPESMNMTMLAIETTSQSNEFAIPYPTYFHPSKARQVRKWQKIIRRSKRPYLFSFVGAPRCLASGKKCKFLNCHSGKCDSPVEVMGVFQNSVFCLQPGGDSYTRRSTFDSIVAGCIPVFFHPFSAYGQYRCSKREIASMRQVVMELIPKVIYGDPLSKSNKDFEDAFDITVNRVLERVGRIRRHIQEGKDPETEFAEPGSWKLKMDGVGKDHEWDEFL